MKINRTIIKNTVILTVIALIGIQSYRLIGDYLYKNAVLKEIVARLEADSRIAEVLVTGVNYNEEDQRTYTTIKFLEYDSEGKPLEPKYFNFSGNIIQFQSLVVRFDDIHIRRGDRLKGRSAYLFWKVFMLNGDRTQEYEISKINRVPRGYKLERPDNEVEARFWEKFWEYALDPEKAKMEGIKNAQIEAPGMMFVPGHIYTIRIEHDGGLRIDSSPLSSILLGEKIVL